MAGKKITLVIETEGGTATLKTLKEIQKSLGEYSGGASNAAQSTDGLGKGIGGLAFRFNSVIQAAQTLASTLSGAYGLLIGQNEELNQSLIQSASTIVATSEVFRNGVQISDSTEAIKSLQGPLRDAIKQLEKDTQQLAGVTSREVNGVFTSVLSNISQLNNQSKEFPDSIKSAVALSVNLTAALQSTQIPLEQISQETRSILQGQISSDSQLAKSLNLNNAMVEEWRSQGILVDKLNEKLQPFLAANKLNAQGITTVSSNIKDLFETVSREAGVPLVAVLEKTLGDIFKLLNENQGEIQAIATDVIAKIADVLKLSIDTVTQIAETLAPTVQILGEVFEGVFSSGAENAEQVLELLSSTLVTLVKTAEPFIRLTALMAKGLADIASTPVGGAIVQAAIATAGLNLAFGKLGIALEAMLPLLGGLRASLLAINAQAFAGIVALRTQAIAAGGGIAGLRAAMLTTIPAMQAFAASAGAAIAPLLPLIALGGAVAVTLIIKRIGDMQNIEEEIEGFSNQVDIAANSTNNLMSKLKALEDLAKKQKLTPEQEAQAAGLRALIDAQIADNERLKASILDLAANTDNPQQAQALRNLASGLDAFKVSAGGANEEIEIQGQKAKDLGNIYQQLADKVDAAKTKLGNAATTEEADAASKEIVGLTQQRLELGRISRDEAIAELQAVANAGQVSAEQRLAAEEAITQITEQAGDERVQAVQREQQQVRRLVAEGKIRDSEGEAQLTALKRKELEVRLEDVRAAIKKEEDLGRGSGERAKQLRQEAVDLVTQIAEAGAAAQRAALNARLDEIERAGRRVAQATQVAESERLTATQRLLNEGVITEREASEERLQITRDRIQSEIELEQSRLSQLRALPLPTDPEERERLEEQIRGSITKTAQLQLSLLENERQAQQALADRTIQAIRDQSAEEQRAAQRKQAFQEQAVRGLEREKAAQDAVIGSLERQSSLLQSQTALQDALANLRSTTGQIEIDRINQALQLRQQIAQTEDATVRRALEAQLSQLQAQTQGVNLRGNEAQLIRQAAELEKEKARQELADLAQRQLAARQANELEIQRNKLLADRAVLEARIAENRAKQEAIAANAAVREANRNLQTAQQIQDPEERARAVADAEFGIEQANDGVKLAAQQVELSEQVTASALEQVDAQAQIAENSRLTLNAQQAAERATANSAAQATVFAAELRVAEASAASISRSLGIQSSGVGAAFEGFKDGGTPSAGQVAWVGEAGPELVKFGQNARVWSNADSMRMAQRALSGSHAVGAIASLGSGDPLLRAVDRLNSSLEKLEPGIQIGNLSQSVVNQVPQNERAIADQVEQSNLDLMWELKHRLRGGRFGRY